MAGSDAVPESWRAALEPVLATQQARQLGGFLTAEEAAGKRIYPPRGQRLAALELTPLDAVKVVILGQDPYHGAGQAHGLAFSVQPGVKVPPSLVNIYKELQSDLGIAPAAHGNLSAWARQGVLLLNASLTVEAHKANSHAKLGWQQFTDAVIQTLATEKSHLVYMLWGRFAQGKAALIPADRNLILESAHPSPLSAHNGFLGNGHFKAANEYLATHGKTPIDWRIPA